MLDVPTPKDLEINGIEEIHFHRFAVAYGLSIADYELLDSKLPSSFSVNIPSTPRRRFVPDSAQDDG